MRILVATAVWFPDSMGGVARVATETARHLARRGHEVTVLGPAGAEPPEGASSNGLRVVGGLPKTPLPNTATDVPATALAARRAGRGFDVALAHQPTTGAGLAMARLGVPLALAYHASVPRENRYLRERLPAGGGRAATYALGPLLSGSERVALRSAARILVLSEYTRTLLAEDHPAALPRVVNVWGGVDTDDFEPGDGPAAARERLGVDPGARLLFTVRRLDLRMGLEDLIAAMARLDGDVTLAVAGTGFLEPALRRAAGELGVADRVRFLGAVPDGELRDWYRAADAFVLPTVAYEGFGIATAEALASGTPVVGTPVGATPELLEPLEPRLVTAGTGPEALADGVRDALAMAGPELRERCRAHAVERLGWARVVERWEAALAEAAG
ncbi:MAG TPA: glycosyltransferase family 4 protein [Thermoleophilaceae bacterium]|jgi:glycosyltransferase involved in cell wall biosynthesis